MDFVRSLKLFGDSIWCFLLCVLLLEGTRCGRISSGKLKYHFYFIFAFECILSVAQYLNPNIYDFFSIETWSWNGVTLEKGEENPYSIIIQAAPIVGTFFNVQTFANTIAIFITIGICDFFYNPKEYPLVKACIILIGLLLCFMTGIRTPFLMLVVVITWILFKLKRSWLKYYIALIVFATTAFIGLTLTGGSESMLRMQIGLAALFSGDSDLLSQQTIFYSVYMLPYFVANPLFGISLGTKYVVGYRTLDDFSYTDVQLMYYLCEVGIVGFIIFLWPIIKFPKIARCPNTFKHVKPVLMICFLLTIIDDTFLSFDAKLLYAVCFSFFYNEKDFPSNIK